MANRVHGALDGFWSCNCTNQAHPGALKTQSSYSGMGKPATDTRRRRYQLKQRMKATGSLRGYPLSKVKIFPVFAEPRNDNERLLNAQAGLKDGGAKEWSLFYQLAMKVAMSYIAAIARANSHIANLTQSERYEKAHDAVVYLCEGYLSDDSFCIQRSITGYLWLRVRAELFNRSKADKIVDYVDISKLAELAG